MFLFRESRGITAHHEGIAVMTLHISYTNEVTDSFDQLHPFPAGM